MHWSVSEIIHISCAKFKSFTGGIMENFSSELVWKLFLCMANVSLCRPLSRVSDSATPWTVDHGAPLSKGFSRHEYWSGLPFPSSKCFITL